MSAAISQFVILCNDPPIKKSPKNSLRLSYVEDRYERNVNLALPTFVRNVNHLPARILDLLELAAYIYVADRLCARGEKDSVEYHAWARSFDFHVRVRDYAFWKNPNVHDALNRSLAFMTGDRQYHFIFYPGHSTPPTSLFDRKGFQLDPGSREVAVLPFSGGLDSLAGALDILTTTDALVCLVSHQSQPGTKRTQDRLAQALNQQFLKRVNHYSFECHLARKRAKEESQRTRSFLFCSIAFAISQAYSQRKFYVFENGVTSMNFGRRQDMINARASRTTHPQTISRLIKLLSLVAEENIAVELPFLWKSKKDVLTLLKRDPYHMLITSAVSCSRTFQNLGQATHCGECFQCIDRRIAAHAAGVEDIDYAGLYATDITRYAISNRENRTTAVDYIRQALKFAQSSIDHFHDEHVNELAEIITWLPDSGTEFELIEKVWSLCKRHGEDVLSGLLRIRELYDKFSDKLQDGSLLHLLANREYLKPEVNRLVSTVLSIVKTAIPEMFKKNPPANEPDLNQKINALLSSHLFDLRSEHPTISFACASVVPDHMLPEKSLLIEAKFIRGNTSPAKASEGIASDLTKYPQKAHVLFIVMDRDHAIKNDTVFIHDIESRGRCTVCILR